MPMQPVAENCHDDVGNTLLLPSNWEKTMNASDLVSLARRIALALALAASAATHATTIVVNDAGDTPTAGKCTLREAITAASMNTATGGCAAGQAGPTVDLIHF